MRREHDLIYQPSPTQPGWTNLMFKEEYIGVVRSSHKVLQGEKDNQIEIYAPTGELVGIIWVGGPDA